MLNSFCAYIIFVIQCCGIMDLLSGFLSFLLVYIGNNSNAKVPALDPLSLNYFWNDFFCIFPYVRNNAFAPLLKIPNTLSTFPLFNYIFTYFQWKFRIFAIHLYNYHHFTIYERSQDESDINVDIIDECIIFSEWKGNWCVVVEWWLKSWSFALNINYAHLK